jgi:predicted permease
MLRRLLNLFRPNQLAAEIHEELEFHRGQTAGSFGNITLIQEQTRAASTVVWLETLVQDIRYGLRQLRKAPVLSTVAVLSLALGIGANTAVFSLVNAVLLRSLPVAHPDELSLIVKKDRFNNRGNFSYPLSRLVREEARSFSGTLITSQPGRSKVSVNGSEQAVTTENVSANYFAVLGLTPAAGRFFTTHEDEPGAPDYAVISYNYWQRQFGMDPAAIGKTVEGGGLPITIVGVAPREFFGISVGSSVDLWTTLSRIPKMLLDNPGMNFLQLVGRRKPGVTEHTAQAEVDALLQHHLLEYTSQTGGWTTKGKELVLSNRIVLESGATGLSALRLQYSKPLQLLLAITVFVLLVTCANIANLLLARATARRKEIAMRLAIGAGRGRIMRQLITESLLLAGFGGVLALGFAHAGAQFLVALMSSARRENPLTMEVSADWRILLFSVAVTVAVGILFGMAPALGSTRSVALNERSEIGETRRFSFGKLLISFQVALTIVLVVGCGLFLRTLRNLYSVPLGFQADNLYKIDLGFQKGFSDSDKAALYTQLPERLAAMPGVFSATLSQPAPLEGGWTNDVVIRSYSATETPEVYRYRTAPGFFATMRIPLLAGRDFGRQNTLSSPRATIVNQTLARQYFAGRSPVGQRIQFPSDDTPSQVVGVVGDSRVQGLRQDPPPIAYTPLAQTRDLAFGAPALILQLAGKPPDLARELHTIHPAIRVESGIFIHEQIRDQLVQERILALLSSFFGGLALLLACIGLYVVLSYALGRRTTEIGVRLALGTRPTQVVSMVLREFAVVVMLGLAVGIAAALGFSRFLRQFLFGLEPNDPATMIVAAATLSLVAFLAAYLPARRASRLDPMNALRRD